MRGDERDGGDIVEPLKKRGQEGFTLLEALVAVAILAFGLMAVVSMINVAYLSAERSKNTTRAAELAAWMIDRVSFETSSPVQPYTADADRLRTIDNDASAAFVCNTNMAGDPLNEPGRTLCSQWRDAIRGIYLTGEAAMMNSTTALPGGRGEVTIIPNDPQWEGNHRVTVRVFWQMVRSDYSETPVGLVTERWVELMTVLASSD